MNARAIVSILGDRRGVGTVELALMMPVTILLILGMVDVGRGYSGKLALEQIANRLVEMSVVRGQVGGKYDYLYTEAVSATGKTSVKVTVDNWLECDGKRQSSTDAECSSNEQIARYVSVRIEDSYSPMFDYGPVAKLFGKDGQKGTVPIAGDAAVRYQ